MKKLFNILLTLLLLLPISGCFADNFENGELQIFLPGEYISSDVIEQFEYEYHVKIMITTFDSNESMYTKLLSEAAYDIVIPSDYMIERLIKEKKIQKLDKSKLTCLDYLYDGVKNMDFDPNNDYSVPYFWGNAGIVYDETLVDTSDVEKEGWAVLKNPKYKGMIYMYDSIRDMFMIAEKNLGISMNSTDEEDVEKAFNWLCDIARNMAPAYADDICIDGLAYGEKAMGFMYSGDAAYILSENENMRFFVPNEGTNYFVDAMVLLKQAKNVDNAYAFINYITDYDAAYDNSEYIGYASVNKDVLNDLTLPGCYFEDNEAYIPNEKRDVDEVFHDDKDTLALMSDYWTRVKFIKGE